MGLPLTSSSTLRRSQQLQDPRERHVSGIKELGRYLRTTISQRIRFEISESFIAIEPRDDPKSCLTLYSDADWANMEGRKSISDNVTMLYGGPVCWGSKRQRSVSTSSTESEYIGMATCCNVSKSSGSHRSLGIYVLQNISGMMRDLWTREQIIKEHWRL